MTASSKICRIHNAQVYDPASGLLADATPVWIRDGRIIEGEPSGAESIEEIDARGRLLLPGLVQTHLHLCQTLFRGLAEDLPLLPWLRDFIWPLEAAHTPESLHATARLACAELIRGGTTAFQSMETTRHTGSVFEAVDEAGLMGVIGQCFMDESGGYAAIAVDTDAALAECDRLQARWRNHSRLCLGIAPRFALSCNEDNMRRCADYARAHNLRLHTHSSEQMEEVALVQERTGLRNIAYLHRVGLTGPDVGLAHCIHTDDEERALLAESGTHVLHCPSANFKLGSGVAPVPEYLEHGISVSIGADGAPCNNRLDMFAELRLAGLMQKPRLGPAALPASAIMKMATAGGAAALGRGADMGRIAPGQLANLILVDCDGLHHLPSSDPATGLVYNLGPSDVTLTMVEGRVLYRDGEFTTLDVERIKVEARRERLAIEQRAGLRA